MGHLPSLHSYGCPLPTGPTVPAPSRVPDGPRPTPPVARKAPAPWWPLVPMSGPGSVSAFRPGQCLVHYSTHAHTHTHSIHSVGRVAPRSPAGLLDAHSELLASQWMPSSGCPPADALQQPLSPVVQLLCSCRDDVGAPGWNGHQRPPRWTHPFLPGPWRATGEHSERQGSGFGAGTAGTFKASRAHGKQRQRQRSLLWLDPT